MVIVANEMHRRPILLSIIAILSILIGLLTLASGVLVITGGTAISLGGGENAELGVVATAAGVVTFLIGLLLVVVGVGLFTGKTWAWWLTVIVYGIDTIFVLYNTIFVNVYSIIPLLIYLFILFYMTRPNTKGWFNV